MAVSFHVEQSRILAGGKVGLFKRKTGFRQAGVAMEKAEILILQVVQHSVVAGLLSFRAQVKESFKPKNIELVQARTTAWGQLAVNVYKYRCTMYQLTCSFGRGAQGRIFIAPSNAERIDLLPMYSQNSSG